MLESTPSIAADGTEQRRLIEKLTLGGPPKRFVAQVDWMIVSACLGAFLGDAGGCCAVERSGRRSVLREMHTWRSALGSVRG